jgi:hypothetical protein
MKPLVRNGVIGAVAFVIIAVVVGAAAFVLWPPSAPHSHVPAALQKTLDAKVAAVEEQVSLPGLCASVQAKTCSLVCTAKTFDLDPRSAATLAEVTAAYANVSCRETNPNGIDDGWDGPEAAHFTSPPTVFGPPDDATFADIATVFPAHAADAAWWYYTEGASTTDDRKRWLRSL